MFHLTTEQIVYKGLIVWLIFWSMPRLAIARRLRLSLRRQASERRKYRKFCTGSKSNNVNIEQNAELGQGEIDFRYL